MTNYIKLQVDPAKSVYEYFVKFEPDIDFSAFRFKLINQNFKSRKGILIILFCGLNLQILLKPFEFF